jgi:hypothetical protein
MQNATSRPLSGRLLARRMRDDVVKILSKLEALDRDRQTDEDIHRDHEARLRMLEAFRWKLAGAGLALGGLAASFIELIARR